MLMDLFYDSVQIKRKRRAHFHEFMLDIHARLRAERAKEAGDPIPPVVEQLAEETRLLCFDEMVVNNTADAAIMSRLFTGLIAAGVTVVTTSNRHPDDLYKDGRNRQLFLPFIDLLKERPDSTGPTGRVHSAGAGNAGSAMAERIDRGNRQRTAVTNPSSRTSPIPGRSKRRSSSIRTSWLTSSTTTPSSTSPMPPCPN